MAWHAATPEGSERPRINSIADPELPEVGYGAHLIGYCLKFGDISYTEIVNWCELTRTPLSGWEAETMIILRSKYDAMLIKAAKPNYPPPYQSEERRERTVEDGFNDLLRAAG